MYSTSQYEISRKLLSELQTLTHVRNFKIEINFFAIVG